jgi:hypothetical protein
MISFEDATYTEEGKKAKETSKFAGEAIKIMAMPDLQELFLPAIKPADKTAMLVVWQKKFSGNKKKGLKIIEHL